MSTCPFRISVAGAGAGSADGGLRWRVLPLRGRRSRKPRRALLLLGDQLFAPAHVRRFRDMPVFMAEDHELCTRYRQHQQKLVLFLSAMRHHRDTLRRKGFNVDYIELPKSGSGMAYEDKLQEFTLRHELQTLHCFQVADRFMEKRLRDFCDSRGIELVEHASPMFLTDRAVFADYLSGHRRPFMKTFYEDRRRESGILMNTNGGPAGGRFSHDTENRKRLPRDILLPGLAGVKPDRLTRSVMEQVTGLFAGHPGDAADFRWPVTRAQYLARLRGFLGSRLEFFGPYQDALSDRDPFLFHSVLSPGLNTGLITPQEVVQRTLGHFERHGTPLASVEGFIRQIIGWREFVQGMYRHYGERMETANFWGHERCMKSCWYDASTGLPPVDHAIDKARRHGYCHHIERLMVLGNVFNLTAIRPQEVYRWFMEMFVDSADWVMHANVYGMGLMSDGGIFATKPYISGSNYIRRMGDFPGGEWQEVWDGLYWRFVARHRAFFEGNPRMSMAVRNLERMAERRRARIFAAADAFVERTTRA